MNPQEIKELKRIKSDLFYFLSDSGCPDITISKKEGNLLFKALESLEPSPELDAGEEEVLNRIYKELEEKAYNPTFHNYYFKEANQVIRKRFTEALSQERKKWEAERAKLIKEKETLELVIIGDGGTIGKLQGELANFKHNMEKSAAQKIGNQLVGLCNEHIKSGGLRFFGVAWADIQKTLEKYGYQHEEPY